MVSFENGSSVSRIPKGNAVEGMGKFVRLKCGAPPMADSMFVTCAKCNISSTATCASRRFQPRTSSACASVKPPSVTSFLSEYAAYR